MDLSIIIVNYKSKEKLLRCLDSISNADLTKIKYEIIIVENDSGDDLSDIKEKHLLIKSNKNLGMGAGNNLGIKQTQGDYILVSNPDIRYQRDTIQELFFYLKKNKNIGIIAPKLLNPDNSLQYSCVRFPNIFIPLLRRTSIGELFPKYLGKYLMKSEDHDQIKEVDWLLGACLMFKKSSGLLFDERYFMYFEDVDLCRQVKNRQEKVVYYPLVSAFHDHLRSTAEKPWHLALIYDRLAREHLKSAFRYFYKWKTLK